jgi:hypothetical protein
MDYSPQNESGLLSLVAALKHGMDPSTAYTIFQNIQAQQAADDQVRQARLDQYTQLLQNAATSGMPFSTARDLARSLPGPVPPQARQSLHTLYPDRDVPIPPELQPGSSADWVVGQPPPASVTAATQGQATSPVYQPNPADLLHAQAQMAQDQAIIASGGAPLTASQQTTQQLGELVSAIQTMQSKGMSPEDIRARIMANPSAAALFVQNFQKLVMAFPELAGA